MGLVLAGLLTCAPHAVRAEVAGIGAALGAKGQEIVFLKILPNTPASASKSIQVGDRLLAVAEQDGVAVPVRAGNLADAVSRVRGPMGSTVRLTIARPGEDLSEARVISLTRGEIKEISSWGDGVLLQPGAVAPDVEMIRLADGAIERLSHHAGKIVVLEFWATWCGPCQGAMQELQDHAGKHPSWKDKVVTIAASVADERAMAAKHVQTKGWSRTHNVWLGPEATRAFHIDRIPTVYVIDRQGRIAATDPKDIPTVVNAALARE